MAYWNKIRGRRQCLWQIALYSSNTCQWFSFGIQVILHIAVASAPLKDRKTQCLHFSENYWEKARKMAFILEVDKENGLTSHQKYIVVNTIKKKKIISKSRSFKKEKLPKMLSSHSHKLRMTSLIREKIQIILYPDTY